MGVLRALSIRGKLLVVILLALAALALVGGAAIVNSIRVIETLTAERLDALRQTKSNQITDYLDRIQRQATTLAENPGTVAAMRSFQAAYADIAADNARDTPASRITDHYSRELLPRMEAGVRGDVDVESLVPLTAAGRYLQERFILTNPNPTGSKEELDASGDGTSYDLAHEAYHPFYRTYLREFGYYDIFLVDAESGTIMYSVFKEIDYGTSLLTGPYRDTNFADVFRAAIAAEATDGYAIVDFEYYLPSYFAPAAFIASAIVEDGEIIGVLIMQFPVDRLNDVATGSEGWESEGLGATGETYLIGSDGLLRSDARLRIEREEDYLDLLLDRGTDPAVVDGIRANGSAILRQEARGSATDAAIAGEQGTTEGFDALGREVIASFAPLAIPGLEWRLVTQIEIDEALEPLRQLTLILALILGVSAVIQVAVSAVVGASISRPLRSAADGLAEIAEGSGDLTIALPVSGRDEVARVGTGFNTFVQKLRLIVQTVVTSATESGRLGEELAVNSTETARSVASVRGAIGSSRELGSRLVAEVEKSRQRLDEITRAVRGLDTAVQEQSGAVEESSASIEEMASSIESVAAIAGKRQLSTDQLDALANEGDLRISTTIEALSALQESTDRIQEVSGMINQIAEQTNLLAMNAAIEAAHAGDAGRGFAVVAEEIRKLAETSATYAEDINSELDLAVERIGQALTAGRTTSTAFSAVRTELSAALEGFREIDQSVQELAAGSREMVLAITNLREQTVEVRDQSGSITNDSDSIRSSIDAVSVASSGVDERLAEIEGEITQLEQRGRELESLGKANQERLGVVLRELGRFRT